MNFRMKGIPDFKWSDFYHWLMTISWSKLSVMIISFYFVINTLFAFLYLGSGDGIKNAKPGSFIDVFLLAYKLWLLLVMVLCTQ